MHSLLERISKLRILVIGDAMLDHYIWGDVHRISPEAPVPVVHVSRDSWTAGGAANVALNLSNLSVRTHLVGHIADDEAGHRLLRILHDHQVSFSRPLAASTSPTIIKTRVVARGQQLCRIDREAAPALYAAHMDPDFMEALRQSLAEADAVIVSDYAKGFINQHILDAIVHQSSHGNLLIAIDPKPASHLRYRGAGILTPNRSEALELAGLGQPHPDAPYPLDKVCARIHQDHAPALLVITLGADGMAVCSGGNVHEVIPTVAREVFDVSGAGDTALAALTAARASGLSASEAVRFANLAAGCVVAHMGTVPIRKEELLASGGACA